MRKALSMLAAIAMMAGFAAVQPAHANACTVTSGSWADPHITDPTGDWNGTIGGNGSATVPYGDIYSSSTDLTAGYLNYDATKPANSRWTAHIGTAQWTGTEQNAELYFWWTFNGEQYFVSVALSRVGATPVYAYGYGHLEIDVRTGLGTITNDGSTTGSVESAGTAVAPAPGEFSITVPMNRQGNPQAGATLTNVNMESRILIGATAAGGLLGVADDTTNSDGPCFELTV